MFPLKDEHPIYSTPVLTIALIVICSVIFMLQAGAGVEGGRAIVYSFGLIPSVLLGERHLPPDLEIAIPALTLVTSMFLHGGWMHLIGNMWFLWIFGNNIEDVLGHGRFIAFYLLAGLGAAARPRSRSSTAPVSEPRRSSRWAARICRSPPARSTPTQRCSRRRWRGRSW